MPPVPCGRESPEHLLVGVLGRAVGIRGEIEVRVITDEHSRFDPGSTVLLAPDLRPLVVRAMRTHRDRVIVSFEEVPDRTAAERLRGGELLIPTSDARELQDGEYWDHELVGCGVVTLDGNPVGEVSDVLHSAANDILVVDDHLIPMIADVLREVDIAGKRIVIDPIPGLLDG